MVRTTEMTAQEQPTMMPVGETHWRMETILLEGARLTMGPQTAQGAAQFAIHPSGSFDPARFLQVLEETYGEAGGRGLMLRIGKAGFQAALQDAGGSAFRSVSFRMLPSHQRVAQGLRMLAGFLSSSIDIQMSEAEAHWAWHAAGRPTGAERSSEDPCCYWMVGFLQEFACWAGGGKFYRVLEPECAAAGAPACRFLIEKKPLD
jgi:hypothetical protein